VAGAREFTNVKFTASVPIEGASVIVIFYPVGTIMFLVVKLPVRIPPVLGRAF
jgi:hypothetical protein